MNNWNLTSDLCPQAISAIQEGIARNDSIYELELLGAPFRVLTGLDEILGIIFLKDLLKKTLMEIRVVPCIGHGSAQRLFDALNNYHHLEKAQKNPPLCTMIGSGLD